MFRSQKIKCPMLNARPEYITVMETGTCTKKDVELFKKRLQNRKTRRIKHENTISINDGCV